MHKSANFILYFYRKRGARGRRYKGVESTLVESDVRMMVNSGVADQKGGKMRRTESREEV